MKSKAGSDIGFRASVSMPLPSLIMTAAALEPAHGNGRKKGKAADGNGNGSGSIQGEDEKRRDEMPQNGYSKVKGEAGLPQSERR